MLAVLDPLLFDRENPVSADHLKSLIRLLREARATIPDVGFYWKPTAREFLRPLSRGTSDRTYRQHLDALHQAARPIELVSPPPRVTVWDFRTMFQGLGDRWLRIMQRIVTACILTGRPTLLLTPLRDGRNARVHRHGHVRCIEKTCWNLRVRPQDGPMVRVACVCSRRNLGVPWTCRYDDQLPAWGDGGSFLFHPHPEWNRSSVEAFGTHRSRPAWVDAQGNAWARPSIGRGHHWDVYLVPARKEEYGLEQLNIVAWGAPSNEGTPGEIHHVPRDKRHALKKRTGWD